MSADRPKLKLSLFLNFPFWIYFQFQTKKNTDLWAKILQLMFEYSCVNIASFMAFENIFSRLDHARSNHPFVVLCQDRNFLRLYVVYFNGQTNFLGISGFG